MRRSKSVKRNTKRQISKKPVNTLASLEKSFQQAPAKMAAILNKDVKAQKKAETKLQKAVAKLEKSIKKSDAKIAKANNHKNPAVAKKQLKVAQRDLTAHTKSLSKLNKELQAVSKSLHTVQDKQNMLMALGKFVAKFEVEWKKNQKATAKQTNATSAKRAPKAKQKRASKKNDLLDNQQSHAPADRIMLVEEDIAELA